MPRRFPTDDQSIARLLALYSEFAQLNRDAVDASRAHDTTRLEAVNARQRAILEEQERIFAAVRTNDKRS